jgi:hypothetical protein
MKLLALSVLMLSTALSSHARAADDPLFKAMSMLAMGTGMPDVLPPTMQDGNYVDLRLSGVTSFGDVLSPGPSKCSVVHTSATQDQGNWAQISVKTYDFSRITGVRYLGPNDDFVTAPTRPADDPTVDSVNLDGEGWHCQRVIHLDPAKPEFAQFCDNSWTIVLVSEEDRKSARAAVEEIAAACFTK